MAAAAIDVSEAAKWDAYEASLAKRERVPLVEAPAQGVVEAAADAALRTWAEWVRDPSTLGLPRVSVTETANTGGVMRGGVRAGTNMPDDVAKTDRSVAQLGQRHRSRLRRAIFLRYERKLPYEAIARELGESASQAKHTVGRAQRAMWRIRAGLVG